MQHGRSGIDLIDIPRRSAAKLCSVTWRSVLSMRRTGLRSAAVDGRREALADALSASAQRRVYLRPIQQKVDRWRSLSSPCSVEHRSNRARRVMHGGEVHIVVSHGPYQMGTQSTHPYSVLGLQPRAERWRD